MTQVSVRGNDVSNERFESFDLWICISISRNPLIEWRHFNFHFHTGKSAISFPIPEKSLLRRDFFSRGICSCRMPNGNCENTTGHRDEGNFTQVRAKRGEKLLGELNCSMLAYDCVDTVLRC